MNKTSEELLDLITNETDEEKQLLLMDELYILTQNA